MLGRRQLLGGATGALLLAACDVDDLRPPEDGDQEPAAPTSVPPEELYAQLDDDGRLAADLAREMLAAAALVNRVRRDLPGLRRRLEPLRVMHRGHLQVLPPLPGTTAPASARPRTRPAAVSRVREVERNLQQRLANAASAADSGVLARLLASMSASVAQHLVVFDER